MERAGDGNPPSPDASGRATLVVTTVAFLAYFAALHLLIVSGAMRPLTLSLAFAPWLLAALAGLHAFHRSSTSAHRTIITGLGVVALASLVGIAALSMTRLTDRLDLWLYLENLAFNFSLASMFAISLRGSGEAFVTRLARISRKGDMPAGVVRYTRFVTIGWAAFFVVDASISTLLFATASSTAWSTFVNLATWPLIATAFAIEYAIRRRVLPEVAHGPILAGIEAFRRTGSMRSPMDDRAPPS